MNINLACSEFEVPLPATNAGTKGNDAGPSAVPAAVEQIQAVNGPKNARSKASRSASRGRGTTKERKERFIFRGKKVRRRP
jgi:hypothetical protein